MNEQAPQNTPRHGHPIPVELSPVHAERIRVRTETYENVGAAMLEGLGVSEPEDVTESPAVIESMPEELRVHNRNLKAVPDVITEIPEHLKPQQ